MPLISVVTLLFREPIPLVKKSVESILRQTFSDFEYFIVINDSSNEELVKTIEAYKEKDQRIQIIKNSTNLGCGIARNQAIKIAKGNYIALHDGDDESVENRLEILLNAMKADNTIDVLGSGLRYVDQNNNLLFERSYNKIVGKEIFFRNPMGHPSIMAKREIFEKHGYYFDEFKTIDGYFYLTEDYDLFFRWYLKGVRMHNLPDFLYIYYRDTTKIPKAKKQIRSTIATKIKYIKYAGFNPLPYLYLLLEFSLLLLPNRLIVYLFKIVNNIQSN